MIPWWLWPSFEYHSGFTLIRFKMSNSIDDSIIALVHPWPDPFCPFHDRFDDIPFASSIALQFDSLLFASDTPCITIKSMIKMNLRFHESSIRWNSIRFAKKSLLSTTRLHDQPWFNQSTSLSINEFHYPSMVFIPFGGCDGLWVSLHCWLCFHRKNWPWFESVISMIVHSVSMTMSMSLWQTMRVWWFHSIPFDSIRWFIPADYDSIPSVKPVMTRIWQWFAQYHSCCEL